MAVVLDASLVVSLAAADPRAGAVGSWFQHWAEAGDTLHAPALLPYEVSSGLTRLVKGGHLAPDQVEEAWMIAEALPIAFHPYRNGAHVIGIALRLNRTSAYDASYLALGEELNAVVYTLDTRLVNNAAGLGFAVHLADTPPSSRATGQGNAPRDNSQ